MSQLRQDQNIGCEDMTRLQLSPNFILEEFDCHDGTPVPDNLVENVQNLVSEILQPLRDQITAYFRDDLGQPVPAFGIPIHILSGYRTEAYNATLRGAATHSQHLIAKAADITCEWMSPKDMADFIEERFNPPGLGRYPGFTHVDIRGGLPARW